MRDTVVREISEFAKINQDIVLLTGDLGFGVLQAFEKDFPKQFFNVGISEQNMTGIAAGLALEGKTVITYSIGNFNTLRCVEFIRNDLCYHKLHVIVLAVGAGFSYGALGFSHHATEDVGVLRTLPEISVVAPGCLWEAAEAAKAMMTTHGTYYLRIDKSHADNTQKRGETFKLGKGRILRKGSKCALITYGGILKVVLDAAELLSQQGIDCTVVSMPTIKPIDTSIIKSVAKKTEGIVTIEEHNIIGGLGSAVAECVLEAGIAPSFFRRMGLQDIYPSIVGTQDFLRSYYEIDAAHIVKTVKNCLKMSKE
jgi:transketolase